MCIARTIARCWNLDYKEMRLHQNAAQFPAPYSDANDTSFPENFRYCLEKSTLIEDSSA